MKSCSALILELQGIIAELQNLKVNLKQAGVEDLQPLNVVILLLTQAQEQYEVAYVDENEQQGIFN